MRSVRWGLFGLGLSLLQGCALVNPYESESMCPTRDEFGKCVSMMEAYESADEADSASATAGGQGTTGEEADSHMLETEVPARSSESLYRQALYSEITSLLRQPKTPLVKPPKVRRVLVLPYQDGALFMARYIYVMVDQPSWVVTDPLFDGVTRKSLELFDQTDK